MVVTASLGRKIGVGVLLIAIFTLAFTMNNRTQSNEVPPLPKTRNTYPMSKTEIKEEIKTDYSGDPVLDNLRKNGHVVLPEKNQMEKMSADALFKTYHSHLDNIDIRCKRKLRMGKVGDGGWEICDDVQFRPSRDCLVYSFGINNDFSFDDDISTVYKCNVISFDPSMKRQSYQRSPKVYFLKMGIAGENKVNAQQWKLRTLGFFIDKFKHNNRVIDVLKMDVENSEWYALPEIIKSGHLRQVKQLLMEYHGHHTRKETLLSELSVLKDIYDAGFRKFYVHKNFACGVKLDFFPVKRTSCYEVHYVNINFS